MPNPVSYTHLDVYKRQGHRKLCAIGEFGLDYYLAELDRERQQNLFEAQLELANEFELPALLHVRRAHAATIATLKRWRLKRGGIIHALSLIHIYLEPSQGHSLFAEKRYGPATEQLPRWVAELLAN